MKDKFEQILFAMAEQEKMVVPDTVYDRVDDTLVGLPRNKKIFRMDLKKSLVLAAVFVMLFSITVSAAVSALTQRMEAMNEQEMEEYFANIYTTKIGVDNYNRQYTDAEKSRMKELTVSYEEEGMFPEKSLKMISEAKEYKGSGVAFLGGTATFFFPDKDMSDEELLQIIDFMHKRDYSLAALNEKIASGEKEFPTDAINEKAQDIEATDSSILQSDAIWDPAQELTIPYTGNLEAHYMAAGQNCIFLTGWNAIHKMEIGSSDSTLFFDDFDSKTRITTLYQDKSGNIYIGLMQRVEGDDFDVTMGDEHYKMGIWILSNDGEVKKKIDLSQYMDHTVFSIIRKIVVDERGYIYAKTYMEDNTFLMIFDKEGNLVTTINSEFYYSHPAGGLGIGKDGKVYIQVEERNKSDEGGLDSRKVGIAAVNVENSCLEDVYTGIVPGDIIQIDIIAKGADTDFVFWGYGGIYTYNLGEESAVNVLPAYEAPCDWEGVMNCALPDGRIVFGACSEYRKEGDSAYPIPEKICFYYKSGLRNK